MESSMSRVRRQSLIVEEKKPKDACSWGPSSGGDTKRDPLNQRQVSMHQSKCRLDGLSGLSSRLNGLKVWCVWKFCPRSGTQSVPSHVHAPSQSGLFPQIFCQLCPTTSAAAIGRLDLGIKQSLEENGAMLVRGGVPLAHSRRSSTQAKFLPGDCAASE